MDFRVVDLVIISVVWGTRSMSEDIAHLRRFMVNELEDVKKHLKSCQI